MSCRHAIALFLMMPVLGLFGCRDSAPEGENGGPPPEGKWSTFARSLEDTFQAAPEDVAQAAFKVFREMGLTSVNRHTSPFHFAVVDGRTTGMPPTTYTVNVDGDGNGNSKVAIKVGMMGDEAESRNLRMKLVNALQPGGA